MLRHTHLLLMSILITFGLTAHAQQTSEADYQAKLKTLQATISQLQSELQTVKGSRDALNSELQQSETDISELIKKIDRIKADLEDQKLQLNQLDQQRSKLKGAEQKQQQQIAQHINTSYRLGQQSNLKLLLSQEDPTKISRMLKYYDYFLDARANKIETYLDTIAELNQIEPRIKKKQTSLMQTANNSNNATIS